MISLQRPVLILGSCALALAALVALGVTCHACYTPRLYWSNCRFIHSPANAVFYAQPEFRARMFGGDKSLRVELIRGTELVDVIAVAATPREAAEQANAAMAKVRMALSQPQPTTVTVVKPADPSVMTRCPFLSPQGRLCLSIAAMLGFWGALLVTADILAHK